MYFHCLVNLMITNNSENIKSSQLFRKRALIFLNINIKLLGYLR